MLAEAMSKKPQVEPARLVQAGVRIPQSALDEFEIWAAEINTKEGWNKVTRSDLMRDLLLKALADRRAEKAKLAKR